MKFLLIILLFSWSSFAEPFSSPFLDFNTPPGWNCIHIAGSWNCNSPKSSKGKGIIVVTAKETKVGYNIQTLTNRLNKPFTREWNKKSVESQPQSTDQITIRNHAWVQSTHLNSEIPNSTTKYLVTIKNGLTVLVSFTAHNDDYPSLSHLFVKSIESLKLNPKLSPKKQAPINAVSNNSNNNFSNSNELDDLFNENPIDSDKASGGLDTKKKIGIFILIILAGVFFRINKKRNSQG